MTVEAKERAGVRDHNGICDDYVCIFLSSSLKVLARNPSFHPRRTSSTSGDPSQTFMQVDFCRALKVERQMSMVVGRGVMLCFLHASRASCSSSRRPKDSVKSRHARSAGIVCICLRHGGMMERCGERERVLRDEVLLAGYDSG